jgi:hypothetical protein
MNRFDSPTLRAWILIVAGALLAPGSLLAIQHEVRILLDLDNDVATGCTVATIGGPFDGVEQILITTVETTSPPPAGTVTDVAVSDCINPATDTFGPPASFDGGWPIGIDNGEGGLDVVETYFPLLSSVVPDPKIIRVAVVVTDELGGEQALLTEDGTPDGPAILVDLRLLLEIPTLGEWGLILLALLLAGGSIVLLGRRGAVAAALAFVLLGAGLAWAAPGLDGLIDDWFLQDRVAGNGMVLWAKKVGNDLCFRLDLELLFNTGPTITSSATPSVPENQTLVIDVESTDPEGETEGAGLTYSLTGGADQALLAIDPNTGVLSFVAAPDFESPADANADNVYEVQVTVTDSGGLTGVQDLQATVTNVNEAPTITSSGTPSVPENQTLAIDVEATDPDGETEGGGGLTYSLTGGADQALFAIDADTGVLSFVVAPDFEAPADAGGDNIYDVQVTVTDAAGLTDVQDAQVTVSDADEPPTITSSATPSVLENQTAVIDVDSTDPDGDTEGAGLSYAITGGADQALFSIVPATGVLTFDTAPDFDVPGDANADNVYEVQVTVTDSTTLTDVQNLQVTLTNENEQPSITSSATPTVAENQTAVIDVESTDPDGETEGGGGLTYSLTGGADQALFAIDADTGVLSFVVAPDFEAPSDAGGDNIYDVQVTVTDAGSLTAVQDLTVTVTDVNEGPRIDSSATPSVAENTTAVITVTTTDPEGDTVTYSLTGGADVALFSIDTNSGALSFLSPPDFEAPADAGANNVYDVQVTATDGTNPVVQNLQVTVTDVAEPPAFTSSATPSVAENTTAVITVTTADPEGDTVTYSLTGGADAALFSIDTNSGALSFVSPPDFEAPTDTGANNVYDVQVTATDGTNPAVQNLQVTVTDVDEPPAFTSSATPSVAENTTAVTTVTTTDPEGDTVTYSLTGGADAALFSIDTNSGALSFVSPPDFEAPADAGTNNVYDVQVTATDGTNPAVQNLQVTVTDVDEPPAFTSSATPSVAENTTAVTTVTTTDPEGDTVTYSLTGGADVALFAIDTNTGALSFLSPPDFEAPTDAGANNVYDVQVTATDGTNPVVQNLQVTVTDVDEAPAFTSSAAPSVPENTTAVTTVVATDPEGDPVTYSLTGGADAAFFAIDTNTGALSFLSPPDFEAPADAGANNVYDVQVTATDGTNPAVQNLQVTVTDVNEPPVFTSSATASVPENTTAVITVTTSDPEGNTVTYSVSDGADGALFAIDTNTGALSFLSAPNFESPGDAGANNVYDVQVTATDGTNPVVQTLQVTVTDVPEAPIAGDDAFDTIGNTLLEVDATDDEPGPKVYFAGNLGSNDVDQDAGTVLTFSLDTSTAGAVVTVNTDSTFTYVPPAGATGSDSFTYEVCDNTALCDTATVTITLHEQVWYVDPAAGGGGAGTSTSPLNSLDTLDGAGGAGDDDLAGDYIFVHAGTLALNAPMELEASQHLVGEGQGLSIPVNLNGNGSPTVLVAAGTHPQLTNAAGDAVTATEAMPVEIVGLSLQGSSNAIDVTTDAPMTGSATLTIGNNIIRGAGTEGIDVNLLSPGTTGTLNLNVTSNSWAAGTHTGNAVDISRLAGTLNLNFSGNTNIRSNGTAVVISGGAVANTTITGFSGNSVHGATLGAGVVVSNATFDATPGGAVQQVDGDNLAIGVSGNPVGGAGMALTTVQGNLFFDDMDIYAAVGTGLQVTGTGGGMTFAVTPASPDGSGTSVIDADSGAAVDITSATIDLRLDDLESNTSGSGVALSTVGGQFRAPSGSAITKASGGGTAFSVANSTSGTTVTYAGTLNVTSGAGVALSSNTGSTISFSGGMTLSTGANNGFVATGGGTVTVTDPPGLTNNTITTTTGTALNVANTTIGASGLTFESISAGTSGTPANGIVLNNTGSLGGLTVTGDGGGSNNGSGGTIQNTSGAGVVLSDAANVNLGYLNITSPGTDGITINNINGFTLNRSNIVDSAGTAPADKGIDVGNFSTGTAVNGAINITNSVIGPTSGSSPHDSLAIGIGSGTSTWNITGTTFRRTGNSGINLELRGTATVTAFNVTGNTFAGAGHLTSARGVFANTLDDSVLPLTIQNNVFTNNNIHVDLNQQNDTDPVGGHTFSLLNNTTMTGANSHAINIFAAAGSFGGTFTGTISGNVIGNSGVAGSGSAIGNGLRVNINGGSDATMLIHNNNIRQTPNGRGIEIIGRNGTGGLDVTVTNNDVNPQDTSGFPLAAILVQSNCLTTCNTVRSDVRGNTVPAATDVTDLLTTYIQLVESSTSTLGLVDTTSPISGTCASELAGTNTGSTGVLGGCALIAGPISTP